VTMRLMGMILRVAERVRVRCGRDGGAGDRSTSRGLAGVVAAVRGRWEHWFTSYRERGFRRGCAETLRWWADLLGPEDAFCGGEMTMYLTPGSWQVDESGRVGVPTWYRRSDYDGRQWEVIEAAETARGLRSVPLTFCPCGWALTVQGIACPQCGRHE
jgi:hypothetical protein